MGVLAEKIKKLNTLTPERFEAKVLEVVREHEDVIVDMNTSQLMSGKNSVGQTLGEYQNPEYAAFKRLLNPAGVVDLKLTGDFHESIFINANKFPVLFDARDSKTNDLVSRYGENIFGLDKANLETLNKEYLLKRIQDIQREVL